MSIATLTPEENGEFTLLNCATFDLLRAEAKKTNTRIPCWLCMSTEAKEEARQQFYRWFDQNRPGILPHNEASVLDVLAPVARGMQSMVLAWRLAETDMKAMREQGNPLAFFV